jgi:hypothetical protein
MVDPIEIDHTPAHREPINHKELAKDPKLPPKPYKKDNRKIEVKTDTMFYMPPSSKNGKVIRCYRTPDRSHMDGMSINPCYRPILDSDSYYYRPPRYSRGRRISEHYRSPRTTIIEHHRRPIGLIDPYFNRPPLYSRERVVSERYPNPGTRVIDHRRPVQNDVNTEVHYYTTPEYRESVVTERYQNPRARVIVADSQGRNPTPTENELVTLSHSVSIDPNFMGNSSNQGEELMLLSQDTH